MTNLANEFSQVEVELDVLLEPGRGLALQVTNLAKQSRLFADVRSSKMHRDLELSNFKK